MIQTSKHKWKLETPSGKVLVDDIVINNAYDAELYVKSFISSFLGWDYEVKPIKKGGNKNG